LDEDAARRRLGKAALDLDGSKFIAPTTVMSQHIPAFTKECHVILNAAEPQPTSRIADKTQISK
jgi:hypothetical protein